VALLRRGAALALALLLLAGGRRPYKCGVNGTR
jgi:hypothetical protein